MLAQGGEFGFAILSFALGKDLLPPDYGQVVLAALWMSIAISPLLIRYNKKMVTAFFFKKCPLTDLHAKEKVSDIAEDVGDHVILCGYGHVGQCVAKC